MKEETLEEAAGNYAHNYFDMHDTNHYKALKQGFEVGAKWQAEIMYRIIDMADAELSLLEDRLHGDDGEIITKIRGILNRA